MTAEEYRLFLKGKVKKNKTEPSIYKLLDKVKLDYACAPSVIAAKVFIKPLSVNQCWRGRRFKTEIYEDYEALLLRELPDMTTPKAPYQIEFNFGFSSASSDWDNPCKPLQDILQKRYGFNDKLIKKATITITKVEKGCEFFEFALSSM